MRIGYARVSTEDQNLALQLDALRRAGCDRVFRDGGVSGKYLKRAGLDRALAALSAGDEFVVWKLDRLGRSMLETTMIVVEFDRRGIGFRSLTESFDTKTAIGRGILAFIAAVAEDERDRISERTRAGMAAARARGVHVGRPPKLSLADILQAKARLQSGTSGIAEIARELCVSIPTLVRALSRAEGGG